MKATMISTNRFADITNGVRARVWEGESESGVKFTAYIAAIFVNAGSDGAALSREIAASGDPSIETVTAIERSTSPATKSPKWPLASAPAVTKEAKES